MAALDLSAVKAQRAASEAQEAAQPEVLQTKTAFLVYMTPDGRWAFTENLKLQVHLERPANPDDVLDGCTRIHAELEANLVASTTVAHLNQQMAAQMQQAQANQIAQSLHLG